jgi:hypothetical protein
VPPVLARRRFDRRQAEPCLHRPGDSSPLPAQGVRAGPDRRCQPVVPRKVLLFFLSALSRASAADAVQPQGRQ